MDGKDITDISSMFQEGGGEGKEDAFETGNFSIDEIVHKAFERGVDQVLITFMKQGTEKDLTILIKNDIIK